MPSSPQNSNTASYSFDWNELAFKSKKPVNSLQAWFIAAPRDISQKRFVQIVKEYLPKGNIVLGIAKEEFVSGFEDQPHFRMLAPGSFQEVIAKINDNSPQHKIYTLDYNQRDLKHIVTEIDFAHVLLVNGSWQYSFHTSEAFYALAKKRTPHSYIAAFVDEAEAIAYDKHFWPKLQDLYEAKPGTYSEADMLANAASAAKLSYDYSFQTGVALGKKSGQKYKLLKVACNKVVPYQTYAMLHGASREKFFSPPHDLNHYDTNHAETELLVQVIKEHIPLPGTTLFINLLPCPSCARMLSETDIDEFVYSIDHSDGYAIKMLEAAGKKVRRVVP
jgi:deoxycytidylate deaminase